MRILPLLIVSFLALQSCSLQKRLDTVSDNIENQFAGITEWEKLPVRTISWNQAIAMIKRNNTDYINTQNTISKAERQEISVYTDLIPGVSFYTYYTQSISNLAKEVNSDDFTHNINVTFNLPSLTQVPYRIYASQANTYAAIKALEGKERELIAQLYTLQRRQAIKAKQIELEKQNPDKKPDYLRKNEKTASEDWMELSTLLGDYSARWQILPSSVPKFSWSQYRRLTSTLDELIICKFALQLEQARMNQYSIALTYLPTINLNLYSPSLFTSTGGTYSGTFLDTNDTTLNMSINYSLDTKLRTWNAYRDNKQAYELRKKQTTAELIDLKQKLQKLRESLDEYYTWKGFMSKRIEHLKSSPTANAAEFLENEKTLHSMQQELINQESSALESEAALILQYGLR